VLKLRGQVALLNALADRADADISLS